MMKVFIRAPISQRIAFVYILSLVAQGFGRGAPLLIAKSPKSTRENRRITRALEPGALSGGGFQLVGGAGVR